MTPTEAYDHAIYIIKGRFPAGEPAIATDARYALYVISGRWLEAEEVIAYSEYNGDYWFKVAVLEPA